MIRVPRRAAVLVAAALAVPVLAACGDGPTKAGAAVTIGDSRVTTTALADRIERSLRDPAAKQRFGTDKAAFQRRTLTLLIDHLLIEEAARRQRVTVTDGEVAAKLASFVQQAGGAAALDKQAASAGIAKQDVEPYIRDLVLTDKVANSLVANEPVGQGTIVDAWRAQFVRVHAAHILVKTKAVADRLLAQVRANPKQFAALAKKFSTDTGSKAKGGDLGNQPPSGFVPSFAKAVTSAKIGSLTEVRSQFGWHVIRLIDRKETKSLAEAAPAIRMALLDDTRQKRLGELLQKISKDLDVTVSPRFGTWDATKGQVAAPKNDLSSPGPGTASTG